MNQSPTRRKFLEVSAMGIISTSLAAQLRDGSNIPKRNLGNTGLQVSIIGLGGYHLGSAKDQDEASKIVTQRWMQVSISSTMPGITTMVAARNGSAWH